MPSDLRFCGEAPLWLSGARYLANAEVLGRCGAKNDVLTVPEREVASHGAEKMLIFYLVPRGMDRCHVWREGIIHASGPLGNIQCHHEPMAF